MQFMIDSSPARGGDTLVVGGDEITFRVTSDESAGALAAFDVRMPPGGGPPMLHRHDPFELYRVQRGELAFYIAGDDGVVARRVARTGEIVAIPGGREHTIRNESGADAHAFVLFSPGGQMERFARDAAAIAGDGAPSVQDVLVAATANGIEITRPFTEVVG
jgi:mannose-6-phosphate isomerase-like protein (cupin superfamily)